MALQSACSVWVKNLRFLVIFLFMKSKGANFALLCIIALGNWLHRNFFPKGLIFLESDKNWISFVFTMLKNQIKIKSLLNYKSVGGRVVKTAGHSPALTSNSPIRGLSPDGA